MTVRRSRLLPASVALALVVLSACEKPAPIVTVVNEGRSTYAEAAVWCFEEQSGESCAERDDELPRLEVLRGTLGVDVDGEVAEGFWTATISDATVEDPQQAQVASSGVLSDTHYYAFELPTLNQDGRLLLTVRALDSAVADGEARGTWQFELVAR